MMLVVFATREEDGVEDAIKFFKFPQTKTERTEHRLIGFENCQYQQKLTPFKYCINKICKFVYLQKTIKECTV